MLEEVLRLFMERYGLKEPDDSNGARAIQGAMRGEVSIADLRSVLTTQYELYPQYEGRVLAILNDLDDDVPASGTDAATVEAPDEESGAPPPKKNVRKGARRTT